MCISVFIEVWVVALGSMDRDLSVSPWVEWGGVVCGEM